MLNITNHDYSLPHEAEIIERIQETPTVFTLRLKFTDSNKQKQFRFAPGQFNMLYLYGVGEVAISIVSDPDNNHVFDHTIRLVGRITKALALLQPGDKIGIRGPFGRGWPLQAVQQKDIVIVTGGIGCAPTASVINYVIQRRDRYGALKIFQGVKHSSDLAFKSRYEAWKKIPNTEVIIAADCSDPAWPWHTGMIIDFVNQLHFNPENTVAMMCGPEIMMAVTIKNLIQKAFKEENIFVSMERNMECAVGHCGHCQYGGQFVCKDGPIFSFDRIKALFEQKGF